MAANKIARRKKREPSGDWLFPTLTAEEGLEEQSLVDVLDNVLNRGAMLTGDLMLGVANVDLIYVKLSVLLAAVDKAMKNDPVFRPVAAGPIAKRTRARRR
jgi:gas vesicle structural protein